MWVHASLALNLLAITPPRRAGIIMQIARGPRNRANTRESDESVTEANARSGLFDPVVQCLQDAPPFSPVPSDTLFNHRRIDPSSRRTEDTIVRMDTRMGLVDPVPVRVEHERKLLTLAPPVLINRTAHERQNRHNYTLEINRRVAQGHSPFPFC